MKRDQTNVRRRVKNAPAGNAPTGKTPAGKTRTPEAGEARADTGAKRRGVIGAKRRIAWHLYEARHDQSEALAWARHDFESLADRLAHISRAATTALDRAESMASKYRRLGDEAAPMLAVTEDLWDEAQAEAKGAGLPDDRDENEIRAAIARLTDRREIRNALSAFERLKRGHQATTVAMTAAPATAAAT